MRAENEKALLGFAQTIVSSYGVTTEDAKVGDVPVVWITPKAWRDDGRILIYVHGGGFVAFSAHSTLYQSALLAARSGIKVLAVDYTTAPAARWPQITDQMIAVHRAVLAVGHKPSQVGIWGDSAGGSIVAGATRKLRDQGLPMPRGAGALVSMVRR
jgi:acetyl esterase/lipase